ncbi:MAG: DnaB-like helicase C-terminal domain-containing protein, partial [Candidatus Puniceispirillum sp.]
NRAPDRTLQEPEDAFNARHADWMQRMQNSENKAEIIVAKQRHGPTGAVQVHFEKRFTHFTDLTESSHLPEGF